MSRSETKLLLHLFNYVNQTSKSMNSDALGFFNAAVKDALGFQKYEQFTKVLRDFSSKRINLRGVKEKLKTLFTRHKYLILELNSFLPKKHRITLSLQNSDASRFKKALKLAIQYKTKNNYDDFLKVFKDYKDQTIDLSCVYARMKVLLKYHPDLVLEFNTFMPSKYRIKGKKQDNGQFDQLPWDVLDIICKTLDFDDLFSFSGVCKNWRTFHKSNFHKSNFLLSFPEPLLVRLSGFNTYSYSFISIPDQKVYDLKIMSCIQFQRPNCVYVRFSSGYFILAYKNNSFVLFNPFTRTKMKINATFFVDHKSFCQYEAALAFEKCSEEYVLVVLCLRTRCLYIYQSRYFDWFTYSTLKPEEVVVDFVVFNNIIYVITNNGNIGVLNLNSRNIKFLNLKNTLNKNTPDPLKLSFKLVDCDDQLLVIDIRSWDDRGVYKIDFSTMNYVEMKTLGDIALFYDCYRNIRALSNPKRFGYQSNRVYEVNGFLECHMFDWNDNYQTISTTYPYQCSEHYFNVYDWCFRHVKHEVDYSLVE